jgi:hypothetical protein
MRDTKKMQVRDQAKRDWAKQHQAKQVRSTAKQQRETVLIKHNNELLARFYGKPAFTSEVANKVNEELTNQLIRHVV